MSVLPHQIDLGKAIARRAELELLNPNEPSLVGTCVGERRVARCTAGLLSGWTKAAVSAMKRPTPPMEGWEQVVWDERDAEFIDQLGAGGMGPDQVEAAMPAKWIPHARDPTGSGRVDDRLTRVCDLCTAVVNRYVAYEETPPNTPAQWREHEKLKLVIQEVLRVIEAALGEAITPPALRDRNFIKQVWAAMTEDDQLEVWDHLEAVLGRRAAD